MPVGRGWLLGWSGWGIELEGPGPEQFLSIRLYKWKCMCVKQFREHRANTFAAEYLGTNWRGRRARQPRTGQLVGNASHSSCQITVMIIVGMSVCFPLSAVITGQGWVSFICSYWSAGHSRPSQNVCWI